MDEQRARSRITVRRTVPFDLRTADGATVRLTINDMQPDPDRALLVTAAPGTERVEKIEARLGDEVQLGGLRWRVSALVVGDRGSVVLEEAG